MNEKNFCESLSFDAQFALCNTLARYTFLDGNNVVKRDKCTDRSAFRIDYRLSVCYRYFIDLVYGSECVFSYSKLLLKHVKILSAISYDKNRWTL